jgi:DNA-binding transcriptional LysR family regulator
MSIQRRLLPSVSAFEGVARTRSFSQTATELGLTQGAISRQVQALEEHIGSRLIVRTSQGCTLTPAARRNATELLQRLDRSLRNSIRGVMRRGRDLPNIVASRLVIEKTDIRKGAPGIHADAPRHAVSPHR